MSPVPKPHLWYCAGAWACSSSRVVRFGAGTYWRKTPQQAYSAWLDSLPWAVHKSLQFRWWNELRRRS